MPSNTGAPGGKRTGQQMNHYILPGGAFALACDQLLSRGFQLNWQSGPFATEKTGRQSKVKYTCTECGQNAWAKPGASLVCGVCLQPMALAV
jgi:hypothetical protein